MSPPAFLVSPPKPTSRSGRIAFLGLCVGLLLWHVIWIDRHAGAAHEPRVRVIGGVLVALLLNHLAFRFAWPPRWTMALRVVATLWLVALGVFWLRVVVC